MKNNLNENNFTKLYNYLQLGKKHTTKELSEKLKLSTRTIQSYLKKLREEYGLKKEKKYYYFTDAYRHIEVDDRVQMSTALMISMYKNAIPIVQENVLQNFKKIPKEVDAFLFDIDFQEIENETYFNQITNAIIDEEAIQFTYKNTKNKTSIKSIYPLKLTNVLGYWYLMGYDLEQDKIKTFYFNNIKDMFVSKDESYLSVKKIKELSKLASQMYSPWFNNNQQSVKLLLSGDAIRYIKRQKNETFTILEEKNNTLLIKMYYYNDVEVLTFVKKWIPFIEIVDNEKLKKELFQTLKDYLLT